MTRSRYEPGTVSLRPRDGVEAPVRPVISGGRGVRQRFGLIAVGGVAIAVLAAGIGLGGSGPVPDPSGSPGSPRPSGDSGSLPPPTRRPAPTPTPTPLNESGCIPVDPANLPLPRLHSRSGASDAATGVAGPPEWVLATPSTSSWPVPNPSTALILETTGSLVVIPDDNACIRYVLAEYLGVDDIGGVATAIGLGDMNVFPPRPEVELGGLPMGDWVVRVVVYFSTGVPGGEDKAVVQRFFRVTSDRNPDVSPEVTPALPCASLGVNDPTPGLSLRVGDGAPVPGMDLTDYTGNVAQTGVLVEGSASDPLILSVDGDACATSWKVEWLDAQGGLFQDITQANETENPFLVSQNRIELTPEQDVFGHYAISASVEVGLGRSVRFAWEVQRNGPTLPPIHVRGPSGEAVIGVPSCGAGWSHPDGSSSYELCYTYPIPEAVRLLTIRTGEVVTIEVQGMTVRSWSAVCGERSGPNGQEFTYRCDLGGGEAPPMVFLPYPGRSMIQIYLSLIDGPSEFYAPYFVEVLVED